MSKCLLIDGYSIINRAFYGMPPMNNSSGVPTGAIYGFLNIMFHFIDEEQPDYLAVAFDVSHPTFRHEMYKEYKGTRKPFPDDLKSQIALIRSLLTKMNIPIVELKGYEADDVLGTLATMAAGEGISVSLVSGDRDLLQVATDRIKVRIPKTKGGQTLVVDYYEQDVLSEYQLDTKQYIEYKALLGDTSDNVPGIAGCGEKTATKLLLDYGSIQGIYEHLLEIKKPALNKALSEGREQLMLSLKLVTIKKDVPLSLTLSDIAVKEHYTEDAYAEMKEYELKSFYKRFENVTAAVAKNELSLTKCSSLSEWEQKASDMQGDSLALCIKPLKSADFHEESSGQMSLVFTKPEDMYLYCAGNGRDSVLYVVAGEPEEPLFKDCDREIILFGAKDYYDLVSYSESVSDVKILAYLRNPIASGYSVAALSSELLGETTISEEEFLGKSDVYDLYQNKPDEVIKFYGHYVNDLCRVKPLLYERIADMGMADLYSTVEMPLTYVLYSMQKEGMLVLPSRLKEYSQELSQGIEALQKTIYEETGMEFNILSPKQLGEVLFEKLGLKGGKKTKSGYSTAADELEKLAAENPIVDKILEYRALTKLKSTYADGLCGYIAEDGRIHTKLHQTITATGRLSSSDPNLQNIPIRTDLGRRIRKAFVPKEGYVFVDADYSQIELRLLAHLSGDEQLIAAYNESADVHAITASKVFHVPLSEVTPELRRNAKAVNFGIVYGISSFGLGQDLSISKKEAQKYIDDYFAAYPDVKEYLNQMVASAKENGYSTTMYGRRRPIPELTGGGTNFMQRSFGERVAMNAPVQGTAADIIKIAMIRVFKRLKRENLRARLVLQIHDELLIEAPKEEEEIVKAILSEEMAQASCIKVRLETDVHSGTDWYEAK